MAFIEPMHRNNLLTYLLWDTFPHSGPIYLYSILTVLGSSVHTSDFAKTHVDTLPGPLRNPVCPEEGKCEHPPSAGHRVS